MKHAATREAAWLSTGIVYAAFAATGVGLTMPGAMLPLLLVRWSMNDERAGLLFFLFFLGSTCGALLSRGRLERSIARGGAAVAIGAAGLAVASSLAAFPAIFLYGMGLGIVMTSVSLLQSRLYPETRAAQMARLNFVWAVGACFGPWTGLHGSSLWGVSHVLCAVALFFTLAAVLTLFFVPRAEADATPASNWWQQTRGVPILLLIMVPLCTGIESAAGGWLSTYAKRSGQSLGDTISAVTWFWGGMLLSRLVQSHPSVARASTRALLRFSPWLIVAGLTLVLTHGSGELLLAAALLLGLGIGPMYPLMLALALRRGERGNAAFIAAGMGAAFFPLLTGLVSQSAGSLRSGLAVPLAGAVLLGGIGFFVAGTEAA